MAPLEAGFYRQGQIMTPKEGLPVAFHIQQAVFPSEGYENYDHSHACVIQLLSLAQSLISSHKVLSVDVLLRFRREGFYDPMI